MSPASDDVATIDPPPARRRAGTAATVPNTTWSTFTPTIWRYLTRSKSSMPDCPATIPALRCTTSRRPNCSSTWATIAFMASGALTSPARASPPTSSATAFAPASSRSTTATLAPAPASSRVVAAPIPEPPPVTRATLSDRSSTGSPPRRGSDRTQEPVQHPGAELQRVHRHALVDAVEQRREVQVGRQPQRGEPEAAHPELGERLGVGAAGEHVRDRLGAGVLGLQRGDHGVHQRTLELGLDGRQVGDPLAGDVRPEQLVDLPQEGLLPPRQHPAVDDGLG